MYLIWFRKSTAMEPSRTIASVHQVATDSTNSYGLSLTRQKIGAVLHSSNEPGELSQWLCHDDSTINIVLELLLFYYFLFVVQFNS